MTQRSNASTLSQEAVDVLRLEILAGRFAPGQPLRLAVLAQKLGFSVSVTREALTKLASQHLVESLPNQGFRVASISHEDLLNLTQMRVLLESFALEQSIDRGDAKWEAEVVASFHVLQSISMTLPDSYLVADEWVTQHSLFHDALGSGCGNSRLIALTTSLRDGAELYRQLSGSHGGESSRDVLGEHRELMELAISRKKKEASAALTHHLELTTQLLVRDHFFDADDPHRTDKE